MLSVLWISKENCPACDKLRKTLKEVQEEYPNLKIMELPVSLVGQKWLEENNVHCVPFMIFRINDNEVKRLYGNQPLVIILAVVDCIIKLSNIGV